MCLYPDKVTEVYDRKLSHQWDGRFQVNDLLPFGACAIRLKIAGKPYILNMVVHVSMVKSEHFPGSPENI